MAIDRPAVLWFCSCGCERNDELFFDFVKCTHANCLRPKSLIMYFSLLEIDQHSNEDEERQIEGE